MFDRNIKKNKSDISRFLYNSVLDKNIAALETKSELKSAQIEITKFKKNISS